MPSSRYWSSLYCDEDDRGYDMAAKVCMCKGLMPDHEVRRREKLST